MKNSISAELEQSILDLGRDGHTLRAIERATGIRRERVSAILKRAGIAVGKSRPSAITVTGPAATTTTASAPIVATAITAITVGDARRDPDGHGQRAIADEPFRWNLAVGHPPAVVVPEVAKGWNYPMELRAVHVRALREGVAIHHRHVDAALRIGIDRWLGRPVRDLTEVATVAAEIHDALTVAQGRIRR